MIGARRAPVFPGTFAQRSCRRPVRPHGDAGDADASLSRAFCQTAMADAVRTNEAYRGHRRHGTGAGLLPQSRSTMFQSATVILIAFAYLEDDGTLLAGALTTALVMLALGALAPAWSSVAATFSLVRVINHEDSDRRAMRVPSFASARNVAARFRERRLRVCVPRRDRKCEFDSLRTILVLRSTSGSSGRRIAQYDPCCSRPPSSSTATVASVVMIRPATEAASWSAMRTTLTGSMIPAFTMSVNSFFWAS